VAPPGGWAALLGNPSSAPSTRRNFALDTFPVSDEPACLAQWPVTSLAGHVVEAAIVSDLRRATGRFPHDKRLANLIQALNSGNKRFAGLWASAAVGAHREDRKIVDHPMVGPITVDCDTLSDGDSDLKVVILTAEPDSEDETKLRLATITGNGSSRRGQAAIERMVARWHNCVLVHTPVHASWLNQVEIFFSVVQRKVVSPNDFTDLSQVEQRLADFQHRYNATATPFHWKFTADDLDDLLARLDQHEHATTATAA